jgi:hypothetical protein
MLRIRAIFVLQRDLLEAIEANFIASTSSKMIRTIQPANEILSPASELLPIATNFKPLRVAREPLDFTHSECMMIQKLSCYILHLLSSSSTLTAHLNTFCSKKRAEFRVKHWSTTQLKQYIFIRTENLSVLMN